MSNFLSELLAAGLIENLGGDDDRFEKIEVASKNLAEDFKTNPPHLIRAILAGLDSTISAEDPAIIWAEQVLIDQWKSLRSAYPTPPINLYRAILLDACMQCSDPEYSAIIWLTAADIFPIMQLGKEEKVIRRMLEDTAEKYEHLATTQAKLPRKEKTPSFKISEQQFSNIQQYKTNYEKLTAQIAASAGMDTIQDVELEDPNPYWPSSNAHWVAEFSTRMAKLLANQLDLVATNLIKELNNTNSTLTISHQSVLTNIKEELSSQRQWVRDFIATHQEREVAEQTRLNVLWWSKTLYSPSLKQSYRELPLHIATIAMVLDLLELIPCLCPASVGYFLKETVSELPSADFTKKFSLADLLNLIQSDKQLLPTQSLLNLTQAPNEGKLSIRDVIVMMLTEKEVDCVQTLERAGFDEQFEITQPELAHAFFRQEQAVRIAGSES